MLLLLKELSNFLLWTIILQVLFLFKHSSCFVLVNSSSIVTPTRRVRTQNNDLGGAAGEHKTMNSYFDALHRSLVVTHPELNDYPASIQSLEVLPKYMLTFLESKYRPRAQGLIIQGVQSRVRKGKGLKNKFILHTSPVQSPTRILKAEIHFFRKRLLSQSLDKSQFRLVLYLMTRNKRRRRRRHKRSSLRYHLSFNGTNIGWINLTITRIMRSILYRRQYNSKVKIGFHFEIFKNKGKQFKAISAKKFMGQGGVGKPFIILYLRDSETVSDLQSLTYTVKQMPLTKPDELDDKFYINSKTTLKHNAEFKVVREKRAAKFLEPNKNLRQLRKSNRLDTPRIKNPVKSKRFQKLRHQKSKKKKNLKNRFLRSRNRPTKELHLPDSDWWLNSQPKSNNLCHMRPIRVDFGDIGWDRWILSPKYFDSNVCIGVCNLGQQYEHYFRLPNHAFIQNMLHAIQVNAQVPSLCCSPTRTAPETLLYYDYNKNLILKSFQDMKVTACGCI